MTAMNLSAGFVVKTALMVIALSGYLVLETNSQKISFKDLLKLSHSLKAIKGHLKILLQCRRQLTFLASVGLGHFVTRIIKESPLTPLPLPPLKDQPQWDLISLPLHSVSPHMKWMGGHFPEKQHFYKGSGHLPSSWKGSDNAVDIISWRRHRRYHRDLAGLPKSSPNFIASAIPNMLKSLKYLIVEGDAQTRQLLLRLCQ